MLRALASVAGGSHSRATRSIGDSPGSSKIQAKRQYGDSISTGFTNTHRQQNHKPAAQEGGVGLVGQCREARLRIVLGGCYRQPLLAVRTQIEFDVSRHDQLIDIKAIARYEGALLQVRTVP